MVITATTTLHDPARRRDVPIRIYAPAESDVALPVVFFSHGMSESRDSYEAFGRAVAEQGYIVIHPTHAGTDREVLDREGFRGVIRATKNPENWKNRPLDVTFAIDALSRGEPDIPLLRAADWSRVAVAGHSAGAFTALALAGLIIDGDKRLNDPRVKAVIAMSMPKFGKVLGENAFSRIEAPVLHITGTRDSSLIYRTTPADRRVAFERTTSELDQFLLVLPGGTHNTFSNPERRWRKRESALKRAIERVSISFLDAYLKGDTAARESLRRELVHRPATAAGR